MDTFSNVVFLFCMVISIISSSADAAYGVAKLPEIPHKMKQKEIPKSIEVQGLIYCKSGPKFIPLKGIYLTSWYFYMHRANLILINLIWNLFYVFQFKRQGLCYKFNTNLIIDDYLF
uniref:Transmembrane protein n=1 Tax=Lactuca sativa TaxID=4236 RepID=A0A9R1VDH7_LACSA|nr:hypothetical protein LSAT_V11C500259760 [Lactuca sativa]